MDTAILARRIAAKELAPVEPVDAVLDRQDRLDPTLQLFTTVMPDQAREEAKQIEADIAARRARPDRSSECSPGEGQIYTKGVPHGVRSHAYADFVPHEDNVAVERIKTADFSLGAAGPSYGALGRLSSASSR